MMMPAPNFETVSVFGIVAISTQLIVFPFVKARAHGTDSLAQGTCSFSVTSRVNIVVSTSSSICKWSSCHRCDFLNGARSSDFVSTCMITNQIGLHSVLLPLFITIHGLLLIQALLLLCQDIHSTSVMA